MFDLFYSSSTLTFAKEFFGAAKGATELRVVKNLDKAEFYTELALPKLIIMPLAIESLVLYSTTSSILLLNSG